jgi:cell division protein FtsL
MAELKITDIPYEVEEETISSINNEPAYTPERPNVVVVPLSPARKLNRITRIEKIITASLVGVLIILGLSMISLRTNISQLENDISILQNEVTTNEAEIVQLEQERNELSRNERIQQIAEDKGLSVNSDNLRKVKK